MIGPVKVLSEITKYDGKGVMIIAKLVENMWLTSYPSPIIIQYDQGSEIIDYEKKKSLFRRNM